MRLRYFLIAVWMIFFLSGPLYAKHKIVRSNPVHATTYSSSIYGPMQLNNEINNIINQNSGGADVAVYVKSMKDDQTLFTRNVNEPLTPASTMKILTAESALLYLGPDYRFATEVLTDAKTVKNGILQGNLYIVLSGDPSLTYYDLEDLMLSLRSQQIQAIAGNVYIDNTAYDQSVYGPGWIATDTKYCYGAPISASIINHNCISFQITPSKTPGYPAQVITYPQFFYPEIKNSVVTKSVRGHQCGVHLTDQGTGITIDGCIPHGQSAWGVSYVVTDLTDYNRSLFKQLLNHLSINVFGKVDFGTSPPNLSLIGQHNSKPLHLLINDMLKKSDNIIAGALFKKLGQLYSRQPGSWQNGTVAVSQILSKTAGVNTDGMRILDGSGLSPDNLVTPAQMMQVLNFAYHHYGTSFEFISALPIAGVDGTLKHRMGNIARKVRAKTGTISGVVSLAGYVVSADKEPLAFVIMINGSKGFGWRYKEMEDKIATALTRFNR